MNKPQPAESMDLFAPGDIASRLAAAYLARAYLPA
jgi:hypothetical protein